MLRELRLSHENSSRSIKYLYFKKHLTTVIVRPSKKLAMESWQVDAENGSAQMMPKGLGTLEVLTSFPLGLCGDPYPTNKQDIHSIMRRILNVFSTYLKKLSKTAE